ncbi:site-specific integrase [Pedobacter immunditicola]|uniref:site-specific integrase n=1 Tax=Pedobacter immunditicola TaxID=3133440 RepID=UPI0030A4913C
MAEINLNLRDPKSEKETPINVVIRYNKQKLVYSSGKRIIPRCWDSNNQKARKSKEFPLADALNSSLRAIKEVIYLALETYFNSNHQQYPDVRELKGILDLKFQRVEEKVNMNFFEFIEWFTYDYAPKKHIIANNETSLTSVNTLKTYTTTLRLLKVFAEDEGTFDFKDITMSWYFKFTSWCNKVKNYNPSTIGKHIKVLKLWLRKAEEDGLHDVKFFKQSDFRKPSYLPETIYLNKAELGLIENLDLSNRVELDRIRDLFLVGAWTGLRFSDFNRLDQTHIDQGFIRMKTSKTSAAAIIPINHVVKAILVKYDNNIPNGYANQYMNRQLKVICKMAGINASEVRIEFKNGKKIAVDVFKWELVSTHTARRSFATNLYGLVPNNTIMAITTHKTEKAFLRYLRKSNEEHAHILKTAMDSM